MTREKYIVSPEIRKTEELPHHKKEAPGVRRVFLEKRLLEESDMYLMIRTARDVTPDQPEYIETHAHNVSSAYIFIGSRENLEGLEAEVTLDDETFVVASPKTVFIPKGKKHSYRLISGTGHFFHVVLDGDYVRSLKK